MQYVYAVRQTIAGLAWRARGRSRRERFLAENGIIPWRQLLELIEPHYPKAGRARQLLEDVILRIYFLQI